MTLSSRVMSRLARLGPPETRRVRVERDLRIPMPDGIVLLADRLYPDVAGGDRAPILLMRTPYGRGTIAGVLGRACAERGYQVVSVSSRGTFGSGGTWQPFRDEQPDGRVVLTWLEQQPWFSGSVGGISGSYCGLTQWAVAEDAPDWLQALAPSVATSNFRNMIYPGGSFGLASALVWHSGLDAQERRLPARVFGTLAGLRKLPKAMTTWPLQDADTAAVGHSVPSFQDWLDHAEPDDPWWAPIDFGRRLDKVPPASMVAGWYDLFLRDQLNDLNALKEAGRAVRIEIGPWTHSSGGGGFAAARDALDWMDQQLKGRASSRPTEARVYVMGSDRWVDLPSWPPPATRRAWHLQPAGGLAETVPASSPPTSYRYDPKDPTPSVGGASLHPTDSGPKDNRTVEARADVLCFTTEVLLDDLTVIGEVTAHLFVRSSLEHTDFFTRLCDVDTKGRSTNLSDGIVRLRPGDGESQADGSLLVTIPLFPTANTFRKGHRLRLQVSSGAHPLYVRNAGSGEPLGKATTMVAAEQSVFHDPEHPSRLVLPVTPLPKGAAR